MPPSIFLFKIEYFFISQNNSMLLFGIVKALCIQKYEENVKGAESNSHAKY